MPCYLVIVSAGTLISLEEYLRTSYSPDREYRDGVLVERNVGDRMHARLQAVLAAYLHRREKQWRIEVYTELRIRVREGWHPIPDVAVFVEPFPEQRIPTAPPLLWIGILSQDDVMIDVWNKANELIANGVPYVWIVDPNSLESELRSAEGIVQVRDKTLRLPGSPIVIPLREAVEE